MPKEDREDIRLRADGMKNVRIIDFHNRHEVLIQKAKAVVSMAGYNTFCEILSLNKRALLIPRMQPRLEQLIRATRAAELGLVDIILPGDAVDPARMSESLAKLAVRRTPEEAGAESMLNGLDSIRDLVRSYFADGNRREVFLPPAAE
jgi:predicted glycosyltransferase